MQFIETGFPTPSLELLRYLDAAHLAVGDDFLPRAYPELLAGLTSTDLLIDVDCDVHHPLWWFLPPVLYDLFDEKLEILQDFLTKAQGKGRNARDLEAGVSWLLWMLGFSVAHLGGTGKTQEAPDLIATTPRGNFAVIECTTGLLKAENKLALLVERAEALKRRLEASGNRHLRVLPIIVTSKTREEVRADIEQAEKLGVVVMTRESLGDGLKQTLVLPDAEALFAEGERTARAAQETHRPGGISLPGA